MSMLFVELKRIMRRFVDKPDCKHVQKLQCRLSLRAQRGNPLFQAKPVASIKTIGSRRWIAAPSARNDDYLLRAKVPMRTWA
jgi:hypothetical protein